MLLAIDVGNTNTVFAVFDGETLRSEWRASTHAGRTAEEYAVWLRQLMGLEALGFDDIDAAILATVVPQALRPVCGLCERFLGCDALVIGAEGVDLGIEVHVDNPAEVGADRLVNAVGAHIRFEGALIVLDFGTATTFDVVDETGDYQGGIIAPGVNLSLEALDRAAAQLPRVDVARPARVIGKATIPAMQSGIYWGYSGLIEGIVARIKSEFGAPMTTIATGGLAPLFAEGTPVIEAVDPDITIRGLQEIYRRNRPDGR